MLQVKSFSRSLQRIPKVSRPLPAVSVVFRLGGAAFEALISSCEVVRTALLAAPILGVKSSLNLKFT